MHIFLKCPKFDSFLFENWAFQNNRTYENQAFQKRARDENSNKKERETESVRILGISKKYAYAIT